MQQLPIPKGNIYINSCSSLTERLQMQWALAGYDVILIDLEALPEALDAGVLLLMSPLNYCDDTFLLQAFACLQWAATSLRQNRGWFVTMSVQDGQFGFNNSRQPLAAGLAGLSKTVSHEWPEVRCRAIDISADVEMPLLLQEIFADDALIEVSLHQGQRYQPILKFEATQARPQVLHAPLKQGDVVLVSGGARGVTAQVCKALAAAYQPQLVLLGRSPISDVLDDWPMDKLALKQAIMQDARDQGQKISPRDLTKTVDAILNQRQMQQNMHAMRQVGASVTYLQVDMCDEKAVIEMVRDVRHRWGTISGVVHGAGVLADRLIEDKTAEQFQRVYNTKVQGLRSFLDATIADDLKVLVLFSSSTARFGRKGQIDYAVANEVMNKMGQQYQQRHHDCRVVSVNWGPWDGGMVTPALKELFASEGIGVIDQQAGADYLVNELQCQGQTEVVILGKREESIRQQIDLSIESHPFLTSHQINGHAVLPMAIMLEWFVAIAGRASVYLDVCVVKNFQVLKGVTLVAGEHIALEIKATGSEMTLKLEMHSAKGLHVRADVLLGSYRTKNAMLELQHLTSMSHDPYAKKELFHGQCFAVLDQVELGESGAIALLNPQDLPCDWMQDCVSNRWQTSPLAVDAAFQMAILWCWQQYGMPSLPSSFTHYEQFKAFPQQLEVRLQVVSHQANQMTANIEFVDMDGGLIARMEGYVCTMSEGLKKVFLQES
ncbi:MAG: SDR family NAD(P)-dependent oxidoreductase [Mariprofundaceae bacterium]|nr:SDR family NAD(P)-dependent oxidoreductase [Mariprofundaceae bacterium]